MKTRLSLYIFLLVTLSSCSYLKLGEKPSPDRIRYMRLQELIGRIGSAEFRPVQAERMYPFTYVFRKAGGGKIIRQGDGFVLIHGSLWCLVQRWRDAKTGNPGQRMLIFDRSLKKFEAEVRQWPEGNPKQRWNHWTCIRMSEPENESLDRFHCEYYYPEGTEQVIHSSKTWPLYQAFSWNENGMLVRITRFTNSFVAYRYEGLKLKLIEFGSNETINTFAVFTYE
ncbi:MAG: hypothetical protein OES18_23795 [Deltaproteobacteria bacterium]|nr:hypothetical protein [Deltaproteobacteria bacterium]